MLERTDPASNTVGIFQFRCLLRGSVCLAQRPLYSLKCLNLILMSKDESASKLVVIFGKDYKINPASLIEKGNEQCLLCSVSVFCLLSP